MAKSDTHYVNTYISKFGDIVNLCTNIEIFRGVVIAVDDGDLYRNKYIDEKDGDSNTYAKNKLSEMNKVKERFSIEIIEAVNSYTRAGSMITVDNANYLIESTDHSIKNGVHYVKLGLRKFG